MAWSDPCRVLFASPYLQFTFDTANVSNTIPICGTTLLHNIRILSCESFYKYNNDIQTLAIDCGVDS
jgi:hypothetical protein